MSKKLEKLKEINILISNILCDLEIKLFIEGDNTKNKKIKKDRVNPLCG